MIFKHKTQNTLALRLTLFFFSFFVSNTIKSQNTIPSTTVTGCLKVDSTMSTGNLQNSGNLSIGGIVQADSSVVVNDSLRAEDLRVTGSARVTGNVQVGGNLLFKNGTGISVTSGTTPGSEIYSYGKSAIGASPSLNPCINPNPPWQIHTFGGAFQVYDNGPSGYTGGNILSLQSWNNGSSIDVAGTGGLLMNYFCGKDIYMCTGLNGGAVFVGDKFRTGKNVQIGPHWQTLDPNVALDVYMSGLNDGVKIWPTNQSHKVIHDNFDQFTIFGNGNSHWGLNMQIGFPANTSMQDVNTSLNINNAGLDGIKFNTWNNVAKLLSISNVNYTSYSPFVVYGDGNTQMGQAVQIGQTQSGIKSLGVNLNISSVNTTSAIVVNNGSNDMFRVLKNGETFIGIKKVQTSNAHANAILQVAGKISCQELVVLDPVKWADFVFEKNYSLTPLNEVEKYYNENKHLKDVPSAKDVKENGINSAEMDAILLQKIEELTLYTVDLNKQVQELKKENAELKNNKK